MRRRLGRRRRRRLCHRRRFPNGGDTGPVPGKVGYRVRSLVLSSEDKVSVFIVESSPR